MNMKLTGDNMRRGNKGPDRGFALLVVIIIILLVSFLASQLTMLLRSELQIAFNAKSRTAGYFLAKGGINLCLFRLRDKPVLNDDEEYEMFLEGHNYETYLPAGKISYYAVSEAGKIDLNRVPRRLMELFFEYHGLDPEQIDTIIDSLMDWRDADDLHRLNGAETETYEELDDPYVPRNGAVKDPAEFFLVNGTEVLAGRFDPGEVFTVHNLSGRINFNSLTPAMLDFVVEGDQEKKDAYEQARQEVGPLNAAQAREILGDERFDMLKPFLSYPAAGSGFYTLVAVGRPNYTLEDEEREEKVRRPGTRLTVLIRMDVNGFKYLAWRENYT